MNPQQKVLAQKSCDEYLKLYEGVRPRLEKTIKRFFKCKADIDDMLQEVYISGWSSFSQLRSVRSFPYWLQTISRRICIRELTRQHRQWAFLDFESAELSDVGAFEKACEVSRLPSPRLEALSTFGCLATTGDLPWTKLLQSSVQNKVAVSYYFEGCSLHEICAASGIKRNTVLSHLRRFRNEFKGSLESEV